MTNKEIENLQQGDIIKCCKAFDSISLNEMFVITAITNDGNYHTYYLKDYPILHEDDKEEYSKYCLDINIKENFYYMGKLKTDEESPANEIRDHNVGKSDYAKHKIQPWDIWIEYKLNPWDADIVKRILRVKLENGMTPEESRVLDYEKIIHICKERIRQIKNGNPYYKVEK